MINLFYKYYYDKDCEPALQPFVWSLRTKITDSSNNNPASLLLLFSLYNLNHVHSYNDVKKATYPNIKNDDLNKSCKNLSKKRAEVPRKGVANSKLPKSTPVITIVWFISVEIGDTVRILVTYVLFVIV